MPKVWRYIFIILCCVVVGVFGAFFYLANLWQNAMSSPGEIAPREQQYVDSLQRACSCEVGYGRDADFVPGWDSTIYMVMTFSGELGERVPVDSSATAAYMLGVVRSLWTVVQHRDRYARVSLHAVRTDTAGREGHVFTRWKERGDSVEVSFRNWKDLEAVTRY